MPEANQDIKRFFKHVLKLRHLRTIAMLTEMGQVSRVAQELNVTQPAISKQIGEIERALDAPIVQRQGNRIVLTPIGERLATGHACEGSRAADRTGRVRRRCPASRTGRPSRGRSRHFACPDSAAGGDKIAEGHCTASCRISTSREPG
ncbi:LysR family transcriptional regulator [Billgrantia sp. C5P2]|uniref:LysR family transcriptional regulator n=1 Tax=Billgrantia sp. C5P2 TaxID=3436239 RepID=UPI003DA37AF5